MTGPVVRSAGFKKTQGIDSAGRVSFGSDICFFGPAITFIGLRKYDNE
jgi:hypothetical protein